MLRFIRLLWIATLPLGGKGIPDGKSFPMIKSGMKGFFSSDTISARPFAISCCIVNEIQGILSWKSGGVIALDLPS